jgi:hypothetical protein
MREGAIITDQRIVQIRDKQKLAHKKALKSWLNSLQQCNLLSSLHRDRVAKYSAKLQYTA